MPVNPEAHKVLKGRDGFLFLHNDSNDVIGQITGKKPLTPGGLANWQAAMAARKAHSAKYGYIYKFLILPNKHCVYSDYLPSGLTVSENRPALTLQNEIGEPVLYPLDLFKAEKERLLYYKTDTHWTSLGAAHFMNSIATEIGSRPICWQEEDRIKINGDLGSKLDPPVTETYRAAVSRPEVKFYHDNDIPFTGQVWIAGTGDPSLPTAVTFCDSFFNVMRHIIGAYFNKIYGFVFPFYDYAIIEKLRPDVVLSENVERFFAPSPDLLDSSFAQNVYSKIIIDNSEKADRLAVANYNKEPYSGIDYGLLANLAKLIRACKNAAEIRANRASFIMQNAHILLSAPPARFIGSYWRASEKAQFKKWAIGLTLTRDLRPKGIVFNLENLTPESKFRISIFLMDKNEPAPEPESLTRIFSREYESLFLYDEDQEVYFDLAPLTLPGHSACLIVLEGDSPFGMGQAQKLKNDQDFFHRGYFALADGGLKPVAASHRIAWRLVMF